MSQKPIEVILTRQLAGTLAMPIFLVDADGTLVFYNEPAERLLGMRFEETGEMPPSEWSTLWEPTDADGRPLLLAGSVITDADGRFRLTGLRPGTVSLSVFRPGYGRWTGSATAAVKGEATINVPMKPEE